MSGYLAFTKKEFMENTRNYRLLIMLSIFFIFGIMCPLTARYTGELLASIAPDMQISLNEPTALDSWTQFYKNVSSLGFSLMIILFSSCLSGEYVKGTLVIMVTKGLPRPTVVLSKFSVSAVIVSVSYWMCFGITCAYNAYFWQGTELTHTVFAAFALWLMGIMYLCVLMLGCVLFRQAFTGILFLLGVTVTLALLGIPSQLAGYNPNVLMSKNVDLLSSAASMSEFTVPIIVTLIISVGCLLSAVSLFNKKQL